MRWILALLLIPSLLHGADPCPECITEVVVDDISGGLYTSLPAYKIPSNYSPYLRNVIIDDGKIETIGGFIQIGSTPTLSKVTGIFPYNKSDGSTEFLVTDSSVVFATSDFRFFVLVSSVQNSGVLTRCKQIRGNMWCSNGIDSVYYWNGTSRVNLDGTNGTPNVPKGKYIAYYQERVFLFNLSNNASQSRYSDFRSTNGVQIAPENFLAWPAGNALNVGEGDGQDGTSIWVENGQLNFGKQRSIHTLFGTGPGNYSPILTSPDIGVASHDSLVLVDGQANFLGSDGIYVGRQRISDHIDMDVNAIDKSSIRIGQNAWELQEDFNKGQLYGSTATVLGTLTLNSQAEVLMHPTGSALFSDYPVLGSPVMNAGTTFYGPTRIDFGTNWGINQNFYVKEMSVYLNRQSGGAPHPEIKTTLINMFTGQTVSTTTIVGGDGQSIFFSSQTIFEGYQVRTGSFAVHFEYLNYATTGGEEVVASHSGERTFTLGAATTGQFISDIATNTTVNAWGSFDSIRNTNGGSVNYFVRAASSPVNVATQPWVSISPGSNLDFSTDWKYVQWASTITSIVAGNDSIDNVTIDHVEGQGSQNRAFGEKWKSRYWLFTSTNMGNNSLIYLRAKNTSTVPNAFMPIQGIDVRSAASTPNTFYAGSSTSGAFYRLDYGTNFNGTAIKAEYQSSDKFFDSIFKEKRLYEHYVTLDKQDGANLNFGVRVNTAAYTSYTIPQSGSGVMHKTLQNVNDFGRFFRFRVIEDELDKKMSVLNIGTLYKPTQIRKGKDE